MSRERRDWHAVCKVKARSRIAIPSALMQSQSNELSVEAPFQEDDVAAPIEVLFTVDLDY